MEWSSDRKGSIAESAIVHAAIKLGLSVSKPLTDGDRYDLIFDLDPRLVRVQCKWATLVGDVVIVRCYSCRRTRDGLTRKGYSSNEIDALAAYCNDLDRCFYFPMDWLDGRATIQLRLGPTRNNQHSGINWADEFAFEHLQSMTLGP
jgi:hypothetical protein